MTPSHFHWDIIAYDGMSNDQKSYLRSSQVYLVGYKTSEEALRRASEIVGGPSYHVAKVVECHNQCELGPLYEQFMRKAMKHLDEHE